MLMTPSRGNKMSGRNAVTGIGTASAIHQVIIHAATAITLLAPDEINVSGSVVQRITNNKGPRKNPSFRPKLTMFTDSFLLFSKLWLLYSCSNSFYRASGISTNDCILPYKKLTVLT